jgi:hypothetical protein
MALASTDGVTKTGQFRENNYGTTLPPLGAFTDNWVLAATEARPWQNTIEYKWLGARDVLDGCVCFEVVPLTAGFGPEGCSPGGLGRCSGQRKRIAQR